MELSLSVILRIFLIFGVFEPSYSYKPYSYKKKRCMFIPVIILYELGTARYFSKKQTNEN